MTVRLNNALASAGDLHYTDHIIDQYKVVTFDVKYLEEEDVPDGTSYQDITIQCYHSKSFAELEICGADPVIYGVLDEIGDNASPPKWCAKNPNPNTELPPCATISPSNFVSVCGDVHLNSRNRTLRGAIDINIIGF